MRKGQGLSVNMLIMIAIGLAVLIISVILVMNQSKKADNTIDSVGNNCEKADGECENGFMCPEGKERVFATCSGAQICCKTPDTAQQAPTTPSE